MAENVVKERLKFLIVEAQIVATDDFFKGLASFVHCFTSPYYFVVFKVPST